MLRLLQYKQFLKICKSYLDLNFEISMSLIYYVHGFIFPVRDSPSKARLANLYSIDAQACVTSTELLSMSNARCCAEMLETE